MSDLNCDDFRSISAEVALGIADARERAEALAHLEHCPDCRRELRQLSDVADGLAALAPATEPPAGFESRLLASLAASQRASRRPLRRRTPLLVAAAAVLAVLIGVGGWLIGDRNAHAPTAAGGALITAELLANHQPVGDVIIATGQYPWISMAVQVDPGVGTVRCQLRMKDGSAVTVGSFHLVDGVGYWAAPVTADSSPVDGAQLVDAGDHVLASASFSPRTL